MTEPAPWLVPTLSDVLEARRRISPYLNPTPLYGYASLAELLDARVFVKHENHQPIGAFKVRGGINLVSQLTARAILRPKWRLRPTNSSTGQG
jgi:threonine dehydratase